MPLPSPEDIARKAAKADNLARWDTLVSQMDLPQVKALLWDEISRQCDYHESEVAALLRPVDERMREAEAAGFEIIIKRQLSEDGLTMVYIVKAKPAAIAPEPEIP